MLTADPFEHARQTWPRLRLSRDALERYVAARPRCADFPSDAYLACALCEGVEGALEALELAQAEVLEQLERRARRRDLAPDDFRQELRARLLMRRGDEPPAVAKWHGQGPLGAWLRVSGTRLVIRLARPAASPTAPLEELLSDAIPWEAEDPSVVALRSEATRFLAEALREALAALPPADRALLRQHYVERMSIDALARLLGVHRSNAARRVVKIRAELLSSVRRALTRRVALVGADLDSLLRGARWTLSVSLPRILGT